MNQMFEWVIKDLAQQFQGLTIPGHTILVMFSDREKCSQFALELVNKGIKHKPITARCVEVRED
jgi:hypothetical protein